MGVSVYPFTDLRVFCRVCHLLTSAINFNLGYLIFSGQPNTIQARSQDFAMEGLCGGSEGEALSRRRQRGLRVEPKPLKIFVFFYLTK